MANAPALALLQLRSAAATVPAPPASQSARQLTALTTHVQLLLPKDSLATRTTETLTAQPAAATPVQPPEAEAFTATEIPIAPLATSPPSSAESSEATLTAIHQVLINAAFV